MTKFEMTQKSIACHLDTAADRCHMLELTPATSKQCWFLAKLMFDAKCQPEEIDMCITNTHAMLTKSKASNWISRFLDEQNK